MDSPLVRDRNLLAALFLVALSTVMFEVLLTMIFSLTLWYHFAFMAISLALFGSGASGVFIYIVQRGLKPERTGQWLAPYCREQGFVFCPRKHIEWFGAKRGT